MNEIIKDEAEIIKDEAEIEEESVKNYFGMGIAAVRVPTYSVVNNFFYEFPCALFGRVILYLHDERHGRLRYIKEHVHSYYEFTEGVFFPNHPNAFIS